MPGTRPSILSKSIVAVLSLIFSFFRFWFGFAPGREKARQRRSPAGFKSFDLSGRLVQAMAVRRHGGSMRMVMTVMAVALHLFETLRENPMACQMFACGRRGARRRMEPCEQGRD